MAVSTIKNTIAKTSSTNFYGVYPSGKTYGTDYALMTIPFLNPNLATPTITDCYVYDSSGNFTQITGCTVSYFTNVSATVRVPFNSSYAGRLLRIGIS